MKAVAKKSMLIETSAGSVIGSKILKLLAWTVAILLPLHEVIATMFFLLAVDFISGIWAAIKEGGWGAISAKKMAKTVNKLIWYNVAIITTYFVNKVLFPSIPLGMFGIGEDIHQPLVRIAVGFAAAIELRSVYENVCRITGINFNRPLGVVLKSIFRYGKKQ